MTPLKPGSREQRSGVLVGPKDAGKVVRTPDGETVGEVVEIRDGRAIVKPTSGLLDGLGPWLNRGWAVQDSFPLDDRYVASIEENAIVLDRTASRP